MPKERVKSLIQQWPVSYCPPIPGGSLSTWTIHLLFTTELCRARNTGLTGRLLLWHTNLTCPDGNKQGELSCFTLCVSGKEENMSSPTSALSLLDIYLSLCGHSFLNYLSYSRNLFLWYDKAIDLNLKTGTVYIISLKNVTECIS